MEHSVSTVAAAFVLLAGMAACSGGDEPVEIEGLGPSPDQPNQPRPGDGGNPFEVGGEIPMVGVTAGPSSGSGGACITCSSVLSGITGPMVCPGSAQIVNDLIGCACSPADCEASCINFCNGNNPVDSACGACLQQICTAELADCTSDV